MQEREAKKKGTGGRSESKHDEAVWNTAKASLRVAPAEVKAPLM